MRTDIHKPSLANPADYTFVAAFYQGSSDDMAHSYRDEMAVYTEAIEGNESGVPGKVFQGNYTAKFTCDHCGAAFAHGVLFKHAPSDELVHIGHICASNTIGLPSKAAAAKKKAETFARTEKERRERFAINSAWRAENEDVVDYLVGLQNGEIGHPFLSDMVRTYNKYGNLTTNQTTAVRKFMKSDAERAARDAERKAAQDEKLADAPKVEAGRQDITGKVVSTKWQDNDFGGGMKMLVESVEGNRYWGTIPSSLYGVPVDGGGTRHADKGDVVSFTATVKPSPNDEHFAFFSRPTKAMVMEVAAA